MVKSDTYALESNVHFPTDYNLLRDSGRKSCDVIESMRESGLLQGNWRKLKDWYRKIKNNRRDQKERRPEQRSTLKESRNGIFDDSPQF